MLKNTKFADLFVTNTNLILNVMIVCCTAYSLESSQIFCMSPSATIVAINETSGTEDNVLELVPVEAAYSVELQCKLCSDENTSKEPSDDVSPRLWYYRDFEEHAAWQEVPLGMDAPLTANHYYMTTQHTLVIQNIRPGQDTGRYQCRGLQGDDPIDTIAYFLDELLPLNASEPYESGNMSLLTYFESQLAPLGAVLDEIVGVDTPDVAMHWSAWGSCENCEQTRLGERWRRGRCRIIAPAYLHLLPHNLTAISCRSTLISQLNITDSVRNQFLSVSDFILYEPCECAVHKEFTATEISLELHHKLQEGDNLNLACPGASAHEMVEWKKGMEVLSAGVWMKLGNKGRMKVDALGTLHIEHAEPPVTGHYTCHAAKRTWRFLVAVEQRFILASEEYQHHQLYLVAMLGVCFILYLGYIFILCCEAPDIRHKIIFGIKASLDSSNPLSDSCSSSPLLAKASSGELELNLMETGSQISGASESDGNLVIICSEHEKLCKLPDEEVTRLSAPDYPDFTQSTTEKSYPTSALLP